LGLGRGFDQTTTRVKESIWHLFEKAKAEKMKAYWRGADLYINDTKVTAQH
jgi:hypothetical protein